MQINDSDRQNLQKSFRNLTLFTRNLAKVDVEDLPRKRNGPLIYACNHRSLSDLLIAGPSARK